MISFAFKDISPCWSGFMQTAVRSVNHEKTRLTVHTPGPIKSKHHLHYCFVFCQEAMRIAWYQKLICDFWSTTVYQGSWNCCRIYRSVKCGSRVRRFPSPHVLLGLNRIYHGWKWNRSCVGNCLCCMNSDTHADGTRIRPSSASSPVDVSSIICHAAFEARPAGWWSKREVVFFAQTYNEWALFHWQCRCAMRHCNEWAVFYWQCPMRHCNAASNDNYCKSYGRRKKAQPNRKFMDKLHGTSVSDDDVSVCWTNR